MELIKKVIDFTLKRNEAWEIPSEKIKNISRIGRGAHGMVFLGQLNDKPVAIKKLRSKENVEIKYLLKLKHPNIIRFKGIATSVSSLSLIMEYCPNGQLFDIIQSENVLPINVVKWTKQIASGMNYLHSKNIIHRDLKSPNILIGVNGVLKIADFGNSLTINDIDKKSASGTVSWMAPELIRNENYTNKVDVWSYGVIVWELLTCQTPYRSIESSAIIWGVGNYKLSLPILATFPCTFSILLKSCWNFDPNKRPLFSAILAHLELIDTDFTEMDISTYRLLQKCWKEDVNNYILKLRKDFNLDKCLYNCDQFLSDTTKDLKHKQDQINAIFSQIKCLHQQLIKREAELIKKEQSLIPHRWFHINYICMEEKFELRKKIRLALQIQNVLEKKVDQLLKIFDGSKENPIVYKSSFIRQQMLEIRKDLEFCRDSLESRDVRVLLD